MLVGLDAVLPNMTLKLTKTSLAALARLFAA